MAAGATPTSANGVITIRSPHFVTNSASGLTADQIVVDSGATVVVNSTVTWTLANGAGTDLMINGTWINSGGTWTVTGIWSAGAGGTCVHNTTSSFATPIGQVALDAATLTRRALASCAGRAPSRRRRLSPAEPSASW